MSGPENRASGCLVYTFMAALVVVIIYGALYGTGVIK